MIVIEREDLTKKGNSADPTIEKVYIDNSNQYIIQKHSVVPDSPFQCRLTIKRIDKRTIRNWRILQDIKNAVVGEESVAIEIYPKES